LIHAHQQPTGTLHVIPTDLLLRSLPLRTPIGRHGDHISQLFRPFAQDAPERGDITIEIVDRLPFGSRLSEQDRSAASERLQIGPVLRHHRHDPAASRCLPP
jgi:hypothetical protein